MPKRVSAYTFSTNIGRTTCATRVATYPAALPIDPDSEVAVDQFGERSDDNGDEVSVAIENDFLANCRRHGE